MPENMDEAIARMAAEDELDAAREGLTSMTVIEYARARNIQPQLIYYYIRTGKIEQKPCGECGRKVIDVKTADDYLTVKDAEARKKAGGVSDASVQRGD